MTIPDRGINPLEARFGDLAKELAAVQDQLVAILRNLPDETMVNGVFCSNEFDLLIARLGAVYDSPFNLGYGDVTFFHSPHETDRQRYKEELGIDTPNRLSIGLATDSQTRAATREYLGLGENIETDYFFDSQGHFAKVIGIPKSILDERRRVQLEGHELKDMYYVVTEMTEKDFVIAKAALGELQRRLS